jgi:GDPmannose 4,6-dehydratase
MSFAELGIEVGFKGENDNEVAFVIKSTGEFHVKEGSIVVKVDPKYFRPTEVESLLGDATKARKELNWKPTYTINSLVKEMVNHELNKIHD